MNRLTPYIRATAVVAPLVATYVAFGYLWPLPGEAQAGPFLLTLVPIVLVGFPLGLAGYAVAALVTAGVADLTGERHMAGWMEIVGIFGLTVGTIANATFVAKRFGFKRLMQITWAVGMLQCAYLLANR